MNIKSNLLLSSEISKAHFHGLLQSSCPAHHKSNENNDEVK